MPNPSGKNQPTDMTYIETDEEVRKALHARLRAAAGKPQPVATPAAPAAPVTADAQPERPSQRPPMALLCVLDDGKSDGEWVRLRADRTVIGKTEGDVRVPHDGLMSSLHAEITRVQGPTGYRWLLTDLRSINGTFVRIGGTALRSGTEFLVGGGPARLSEDESLTPEERAIDLRVWLASLREGSSRYDTTGCTVIALPSVFATI